MHRQGRWKLDVCRHLEKGMLLRMGCLVVGNHLVESGYFLKEHLQSHILLSALALEGGEGFSEGGKAFIIGFGVVGTVVN